MEPPSADSAPTALYFYGKGIPAHSELTQKAVSTYLKPDEVDKIVDAVSDLRDKHQSHVMVTWDHELDKCGRMLAAYRTKDNGLGCIGTVDDPEKVKLITERISHRKAHGKPPMGLSPLNIMHLAIDTGAPLDPTKSGKDTLEMYHMSLVEDPDFGDNGTWVQDYDTDPSAFFSRVRQNLPQSAAYINKNDMNALNLMDRRVKIASMYNLPRGTKGYYKAHSKTASDKEIAIDNGSQLGMALKEIAPATIMEYAPPAVVERYKNPGQTLRPAPVIEEIVEPPSVVVTEQAPEAAAPVIAADTNKTEEIPKAADPPVQVVNENVPQPSLSESPGPEIVMEGQPQPQSQPQQPAVQPPAQPQQPAAAPGIPANLLNKSEPFKLQIPGLANAAPAVPAPAAPAQPSDAAAAAPAPAEQPNPNSNTGAEVPPGRGVKRSHSDTEPATQDQTGADTSAPKAADAESVSKRVATETKKQDPSGNNQHQLAPKQNGDLPVGMYAIAPEELEKIMENARKEAVQKHVELQRRQDLLNSYHESGATQEELAAAAALLSEPGSAGENGYNVVKNIVVKMKASKAGANGPAGIQSGREAEARLQQQLHDLDLAAKSKAGGVAGSEAPQVGQAPNQAEQPRTPSYMYLTAELAASRFGAPNVSSANLQLNIPASAPAQSGAFAVGQSSNNQAASQQPQQQPQQPIDPRVAHYNRGMGELDRFLRLSNVANLTEVLASGMKSQEAVVARTSALGSAFSAMELDGMKMYTLPSLQM